MDYRNYDRGYAEPTMSASDYMTRTYRWMAVGLLITFAAAFVTAATPLLYVVNSLYLVFTIAELVLVYVLSSRGAEHVGGRCKSRLLCLCTAQRHGAELLFPCFLGKHPDHGAAGNVPLLRLMAVYGTTTHKDLTGWGPRLMMALVAMIITGFVGMLFGFGFGGSVLYCGDRSVCSCC